MELLRPYDPGGDSNKIQPLARGKKNHQPAGQEKKKLIANSLLEPPPDN